MKIGVLGAGQLGRMLALSGIPLGHEFIFYTDRKDSCAAVAGEVVHGEFDDKVKLAAFAGWVDVVTLEFENIPLSTLEYLAQHVTVYPNPAAVAAAQDRLDEKRLFDELGIPVASYHVIDSLQDIKALAPQQDGPYIIKTRRLGYDGKGQAVFSDASQASDIWFSLGEVPLIAEEKVPFSRELSIIAVRNPQGEIRYYPLCENRHQDGILAHTSLCRDSALQEQAESFAKRVLEKFDYVGVLTIELFDCDGKLVANEMAPRVHNSGHWSIEGASTSQFENHVRAVLDLPLGETTVLHDFHMYNLITKMPDSSALLSIPNLHLHDYNKTPAFRRKLGHLTVYPATDDTPARVEALLTST